MARQFVKLKKPKKMKIITDSFEALDMMDYAQAEGCTFTVKANTITAKRRLMPKMPMFQIRTKKIDPETLEYIKTKYLAP